jgi:hypothetical protein
MLDRPGPEVRERLPRAFTSPPSVRADLIRTFQDPGRDDGVEALNKLEADELSLRGIDDPRR